MRQKNFASQRFVIMLLIIDMNLFRINVGGSEVFFDLIQSSRSERKQIEEKLDMNV